MDGSDVTIIVRLIPHLLLSSTVSYLFRLKPFQLHSICWFIKCKRDRTAYVLGGERERFNPLSGARYERGETHDANDLEENQVSSTSKNPTKDSYKQRGGRPKFFKKDGSKWKGKGRENSPYQRNVSETNVKTVEINNKTKEK